MNINEKKQLLRQKMKALRETLNPETKQLYDQWVCKQLLWKVEELNAKIVHTYLPMGSEIDIHPFIQKALNIGKRIICPKTLPKRQLEHLVLEDLEHLEEGRWGTQHPAGGNIYQGPIDLIIVPGLAFDAQIYRLGYGGGYYDNFLSQYPETYTLAIAYPFQIVEEVPREAHDFQLEEVLWRPLEA